VTALEFHNYVFGRKVCEQKGQSVLVFEVCKVRELVGELVACSRIGEELPIALAFA
jgi:hypothetical protein